MSNGVPDAARPHVAVRLLPSAPQPYPSPVQRQQGRFTRLSDDSTGCLAVGLRTALPRQPPGPGPSGRHEKHPGLAATRLTFVFAAQCLFNLLQKGHGLWSIRITRSHAHYCCYGVDRSESHEHAMSNGVPDAARPHVAGRLLPSAPQPCPSPVQRQQGRFTRLSDDSTGCRKALQLAFGRRYHANRPALALLGGMKNIPVSPLRG